MNTTALSHAVRMALWISILLGERVPYTAPKREPAAIMSIIFAPVLEPSCLREKHGDYGFDEGLRKAGDEIDGEVAQDVPPGLGLVWVLGFRLRGLGCRSGRATGPWFAGRVETVGQATASITDCGWEKKVDWWP